MATVDPLAGPLTTKELELINAYWRAANYLSVGQIYLVDNPLIRSSLALENIKPRLLGHWGTTPGLNLLYAHLNRLIRARDLNVIFVCGPGHGGPGVVANTYMRGRLGPAVGRSGDRRRRQRRGHRLRRQISAPGSTVRTLVIHAREDLEIAGECQHALVRSGGPASGDLWPCYGDHEECRI
jgi:xylulose-5-phosphate/fructose-6-phosphate phosphoketolase